MTRALRAGAGPIILPLMGAPIACEADVDDWSREQAALLRRLPPHGLPRSLDLPHIAEEIEDGGNSARNAVASHLVRMLEHAAQLASSPAAPPVRGWRREVLAQQDDAIRRFTPGMARDLDPDQLWRDATRLAAAGLEEHGEGLAGMPPARPFALPELLDDMPPAAA